MATKIKSNYRLDENFTFLRKLLSVETLFEEINQEEALEFLDAIENQYRDLKEALADAEKEVKDLDAAIEKKAEKIEDLENEVEELKESPEMFDSIKTCEQIHYSASNLQDQDVMEALAAAYEKLSPYQIVERLKT